jgi:hypothetical protein
MNINIIAGTRLWNRHISASLFALLCAAGCVIDQRSSESGAIVHKSYFDSWYQRTSAGKNPVRKIELIARLGAPQVVKIPNSSDSEFWVYASSQNSQFECCGLFVSIHTDNTLPTRFSALVETKPDGVVKRIWLCDSHSADFATFPCPACYDEQALVQAEKVAAATTLTTSPANGNGG